MESYSICRGFKSLFRLTLNFKQVLKFNLISANFFIATASEEMCGLLLTEDAQDDSSEQLARHEQDRAMSFHSEITAIQQVPQVRSAFVRAPRQ